MFEIPFLEKLLSTLSNTYYLNDIVDRLHGKITVIVLILCAMFVGAKQQFGQPIQCMLPAHLDRNSWTNYGQYNCFLQNTYRLAYNKTIPDASSRAEYHANNAINYYQWVPFFLTIQALCFYIPGWLWITLQSQRTLDMEAIIREAISLERTFKFEDRRNKLTNLIDYIALGLKMTMNMNTYRTSARQVPKSTTKFSRLEKKWHKYRLDSVNGVSVALYFVSKLLNVVNDIVQLYIIGRFIGFSIFFWPFTKMSLTSSYFPLVTFCDMERQILGRMEVNTLQCVLMLNFINEKMFFLLWCWIFLLFVISLANFIITFVQYVPLQCREISIKFYLQEGELDEWGYFLLKDKRHLHIYVVEFLGLDGALLLRFLNNHAGIIVTRVITVGLWQYFCLFYRDSSFCTSREIVVNVEKFDIADSYSLSLSPIL